MSNIIFNSCFWEDTDGKAGIYRGRENRIQRKNVSNCLILLSILYNTNMRQALYSSRGKDSSIRSRLKKEEISLPLTNNLYYL